MKTIDSLTLNNYELEKLIKHIKEIINLRERIEKADEAYIISKEYLKEYEEEIKNKDSSIEDIYNISKEYLKYKEINDDGDIAAVFLEEAIENFKNIVGGC